MSKFSASYIDYKETNSFSKTVYAYLENNEKLRPFITEFPSVKAIQKQISLKEKEPINRQALVSVLKEQYQKNGITVPSQIALLADENTFTVCTAHQPNIFTGYLYFIYKIIHAIKLAKECDAQIKGKKFVPIFFIGSEDNDIEEIGTFHFKNKQYQWTPNESGACGRFSTDSLKKIRNEIIEQLGETEIEQKLKKDINEAYNGTRTLAQATQYFVHTLLGQYGIIALDADDARLKECFAPIIKEELNTSIVQELVEKQIKQLPAVAKVQVEPRSINLFYLNENRRDRIESFVDDRLQLNTKEQINFSSTTTEHYSPNVILRPLYQEMILPNVAFIGGGSEVAYWLELKVIFDYFKVAFPIVLTRNSVAIVDKKAGLKMNAFKQNEYFKPIDDILKIEVQNDQAYIQMQEQLEEVKVLYQKITAGANDISPSLDVSSKAQIAKIEKLHKRLLTKYRAHLKRRETDIQEKIIRIQSSLFPEGKLQERHENIIELTARYKTDMIAVLMKEQMPLKREFLILSEQ